MKRLILASVVCIASAIGLRAQDVFLVNPAQAFPLAPTAPKAVGSEIRLVPPSSLALTFKVNGSVCSAPLTEAHVDANDPGIAIMPQNSSVAIPMANVPEPPCPSQSGTTLQAMRLDPQLFQQPPEPGIFFSNRPVLAVPGYLLGPGITPGKEAKKLRILQLSPHTDVCSVPLIEAQTDANDPGIAVSPRSSVVPMRRANVPAPACEK